MTAWPTTRGPWRWSSCWPSRWSPCFDFSGRPSKARTRQPARFARSSRPVLEIPVWRFAAIVTILAFVALMAMESADALLDGVRIDDFADLLGGSIPLGHQRPRSRYRRPWASPSRSCCELWRRRKRLSSISCARCWSAFVDRAARRGEFAPPYRSVRSQLLSQSFRRAPESAHRRSSSETPRPLEGASTKEPFRHDNSGDSPGMRARARSRSRGDFGAHSPRRRRRLRTAEQRRDNRGSCEQRWTADSERAHHSAR